MCLTSSRAATARSVVSCLLALSFLTGCSDPGALSLARPQTRSQKSEALSSGYAGTAQFDAPVVNPSTWQGTPIGTGTWSTSATPPASGGPSAIGFLDTQSGVTAHYLMVGNLAAGGKFFGIISEGQLLSVGTSTINNTTLYAGVFDAATGDPVALASSGTITLSAAASIGGRITGSFSGTLDDVAPTSCTSSAQCASNELCVSGTCVRQGCTSNSQCAAGQTCVAGQCVTATVPSCEGMQGSGSYTGSLGSLAVCSAFGGAALNVTRAFAALGRDGAGALSLFVMDPALDSAGVLLPLSGCPSAPSTVSSSAVFWDQTSSGGVTFYAARPATSAAVSFSQVGSSLQGTFWVSLTGGGRVKGTFDVR